MTAKQEATNLDRQKWMWPFELLEQIGEGGMGVVYRARYVVNDREVALKMLPSDVTDETTLARFERELEVLKNLKHPNIVRCFGGSCENKRRFYAMELISEGSLEDKLQENKKLPWEQVIFYALQMCDALECSHEKKVIHRDVKPSNFLITKSGQLKLSDFGLASVAAARKITAAGKTAGTFLYMAPEQIRGLEVSPQTDLYALGCVLYELVTGEPPFLGSTPAATLHMHCRDTPPRPTEKTFDCPVALERVILQLLEKEEKDRQTSAAEVGRQLRSVRQTVTVVSNPNDKGLDRPLQRPELEDPATAFFKTVGPGKILKHDSIPNWVVISLFVSLLCSLSWNLVSSIQARSGRQGEKLWVEAATHSQQPVRIEAIGALGKIAGESGHNLDVIRNGLNDESWQIREASVLAMEEGGGHAKKFIPALMQLSKQDENEKVRSSALKAVETLKAAKTRYNYPIGGILIGTMLFAATGAGIFYWMKS
ncbi:serine/threonine-protein kinase [Thalassoglobus polymorphus]|nr:serine/threonine-protein kinase [Thalassoglobus polymorphus]